MAHTIAAVQTGSIADQLKIRPGDKLLSLNGKNVVDWIDYQAFSSNEKIELIIRRNEEEIEFNFEKDEYEPLGLVFSTQLMTPVRTCCNRCVFCFVDQLPPDTRDTMHFKDDDWRLSLMMGNFVTMTNVTENELNRIIERKASPLYISVHATDPALRVKMLNTPRAANIMAQLKKLKENGLTFHAQAVLCPGYNDGPALDQTIRELSDLYPAAQSLALVPVGLTKHRGGLDDIRPYDAKTARAVMDQVEMWRARLKKEIGVPFVHAADEFYILADVDFPPEEDYSGYPQIENGIGLCRLLYSEYVDAWNDAELSKAKEAHYTIATGTSAAPFLKQMLAQFPVPGVKVDIVPLTNHFFGDTVTTAGLLTGGDIIRQMQDVKTDALLITGTMLREGEDVFLDDTSLNEVRQTLGVPVRVVERGGEDLLRALMGEK